MALDRLRQAKPVWQRIVRERAERGLKVDDHSVWDVVRAQG